MSLCFSADDDALSLSETIDDNSLEILMGLGVKKRFPNEYATWERRREEITQRFHGSLVNRLEEMHTKLGQTLEDIRLRLREAVVTQVLKTFP
jgi:hypothetical protein